MTEPIRVLHVDDDPDFAELTATFLERTDDRFAVETAHDASAALDRLDDGDGIDCVVSDYDMPGTNGIELLEAVREDRPDLPFVLFTGKGSEEVASDAITAGVTDYLQKKGGSDQYDLLTNRIRNAVEGARAEERARLWTRAVETANEGISVIDEDGRYVEMNEAYADCYGVEPADLIGESWTKTVPDDEAERLNEEVFPGLTGDDQWVGDSIGRRADGSTYPKVLSLAPLGTGGHVCVIRDVSGDRERERDRERADRRPAATADMLFDRSPDMIAIHDADGRILEVNRRLCDTLGYGEAELVGTDIAEVDEALDPDEARGRRREMDPGETRDREGRYRRADGSTFPVEARLVKAHTPDGVRFVVFGRNVSDDRERESERAILERGAAQIEAGVGAYDADGTLVFFNDHYANLLGTTPTDLRDRKVWEANPLLEAERFGDYWDSYDRGETRVHETLHRRFDTDEELPVRTTTTRVRVDGDDYHVGTVADISEQRARERRLEREVERLDEFASVVSHDLRNPLSVADGRLRLVREEHDSAHLEDIERALDRMEALIDDLLAFAREGEEVHEPASVDLRTTVQACWGNVDTAGATLTVDTDRTVRADESRLRQLFENLLGNAVEHGGDSVVVGDLPDGFYVEDDGPGVDTGISEDVFETGVTTSTEGTGFGLSIARQITDAHGWTIRVTEGTDGGARFEVTGVSVVA